MFPTKARLVEAESVVFFRTQRWTRRSVQTVIKKQAKSLAKAPSPHKSGVNAWVDELGFVVLLQVGLSF